MGYYFHQFAKTDSSSIDCCVAYWRGKQPEGRKQIKPDGIENHVTLHPHYCDGHFHRTYGGKPDPSRKGVPSRQGHRISTEIC